MLHTACASPLQPTASLMAPTQGWQSKTWVLIIVLPVTHCVTLRKSLNLPESSSPVSYKEIDHQYKKIPFAQPILDIVRLKCFFVPFDGTKGGLFWSVFLWLMWLSIFIMLFLVTVLVFFQVKCFIQLSISNFFWSFSYCFIKVLYISWMLTLYQFVCQISSHSFGLIFMVFLMNRIS